MRRNLAVILWVAALEALFIPLAYLSFRRPSYFLGYFEQIHDHQVAISFCLFLLFALYSAGVWYADRLNINVSPQRLALILGPFLLLLVLTPPMLSLDPAGYLAVAKNTVAYGANPYQDVVSAYPGNPWLASLGDVWWKDSPSPYGPLFLASILPFAALPIQNLSVAIAVYKAVLAVVFVASWFVFDRLRSVLKLPSATLLLYAANPVILFYGILEGHNDVIVMILLLCAALAFERQRLSGHLAFAAAAAMKYVPVILLPLAWFENRRIAWKQVVLSLGTLAAVMLAASSVYGFSFVAMFESLRQQGSLVCFLHCTPMPLLLVYIFGHQFRWAGLAIFGCFWLAFTYAFLWKRTLRIPFVFSTLFVFILFALIWVTPWYFILLVPFGVLLSDRLVYRVLFLASTAVSLLFYPSFF